LKPRGNVLPRTNGDRHGSGGLTSARDRIRASMSPADLISTALLVRRGAIWETFTAN
jgi:hypothetical protein